MYRDLYGLYASPHSTFLDVHLISRIGRSCSKLDTYPTLHGTQIDCGHSGLYGLILRPGYRSREISMSDPGFVGKEKEVSTVDCH